jgi:hypothetical protein
MKPCVFALRFIRWETSRIEIFLQVNSNNIVEVN